MEGSNKQKKLKKKLKNKIGTMHPEYICKIGLPSTISFCLLLLLLKIF